MKVHGYRATKMSPNEKKRNKGQWQILRDNTADIITKFYIMSVACERSTVFVLI